jgi:hypothetical protein
MYFSILTFYPFIFARGAKFGEVPKFKLKIVVKLNLSNATHRASPAGRRPAGRE